MRVATWNVLHRIHALNWREPAIDAYPDEATRAAVIADVVARLGDVVCLQEVSGDQLATLRAKLPEAAIASHRYPRVPRPRRVDETSPLADAHEHLVVVSMPPIRRSHGHTFDTDRGKGYLVVELESGVVVIDTHVSFGASHAVQCAELAAVAAGFAGPVVLVGDFNADRDTCLSHLGGAFTAAIPAEPALPTRLRTVPSEKSATIDHVMTVRARASDVAVIDGDALSDHNPVVARVL